MLLEKSNDPAMAGATAVADIDLIGTELLAAFQFDDDIETRKLGYVGSKRTSGPLLHRPATMLAISFSLASGCRDSPIAILRPIRRSNSRGRAKGLDSPDHPPPNV